MRTPSVVLVIATLLAGCGATRTPSAALRPLFTTAGARSAHELAPDLYAQALEERRKAIAADDAGDRDAAADYATSAHLLIDAAMTEAERIRLERRRLALETETRKSVRTATRDEKATQHIERELSRELATRTALEQADRAFADAAAFESKRLLARGKAGQERYQKAATALEERTEMVLAAARALGAEAADVDRVEAMVRAARDERDPTRALAGADDAQRAAQVVLGKARAREPAPGPDEVASLVTDAGRAGFEVERLARGMAIRPTGRGAFAGPAARRLATLLEAYPHGPARIEVGSRREQARARRLAANLERYGVRSERLDINVMKDAAMQVVLVAYGHAPEASTAAAGQPPR